jgi:hypothetical protein
MTHRKRILTAYAEWTAMSAMRSGAPIKSRTDIYPLLRGAIFAALLDPPDRKIEQEEFDAWHKQAVEDMIKDDGRLVVGWAAKLLNVYLKTYAYIGDGGRPGLKICLHPPIDAGLWRGLRNQFGKCNEIVSDTHCVNTIREISTYEKYQRIVKGLRLAAQRLGCSLFEVEQLWEIGPARNSGDLVV